MEIKTIKTNTIIINTYNPKPDNFDSKSFNIEHEFNKDFAYINPVHGNCQFIGISVELKNLDNLIEALNELKKQIELNK